MSLADLRTAVFDQVDWAPNQSTDAKRRVDGFINRAQRLLSMDCPFAFFEDEFSLATRGDWETDDASVSGDTVSTSSNGDDWVLERDLATTSLAAGDLWPVDGSWDGRMIALTHGTNDIRRHRIRTIWTTGTTQFISIDTPAAAADTYSAVEYRIYDEGYYLPDDIIQISSIRMHRANEATPLRPLGQDAAEKMSLKDLPSQTATGRPRSWYRIPEFRMPTPTYTPAVALDAEFTWNNDQPAGTFDYCFTYCWGWRDVEFSQATPPIRANAHDPILQPLWESAPSPISAEITVVYNADAIKVTLPDVDYMLGFGEAGTDRLNKSGWYKRVYRRRISVTSGNGNEYIEAPDVFYYLDDVDGSVTTLDDRGYAIPDTTVRLDSPSGFMGIGLYPRPDDRYVLDIRAIRKPMLLEDDQDEPYVHEEAQDAIVDRALAFLYEAEGNQAMMTAAMQRYWDHVSVIAKRYGPGIPPTTIWHRIPARARGYRRARKSWV